MRLNRLGHIVERTWAELPEHYLHVELDLFVVMPNHVHGVILLVDDEPPRAMTGAVHAAGPGLSAEAVLGVQGGVGAGLKPAPTRPRRHAVPEIVRAFKTFSSRKINQCRFTVGARVWQRGYYERVIRRETELSRIRDYIQDNPHGWNTDVENPFAEGALPDVRRWDG
jgi:REP element-mobilizing transposase RayT